MMKRTREKQTHVFSSRFLHYNRYGLFREHGILAAMKPDIHRLLELQKLWAAFNQIDRAVHRDHLGTFVAENDTEHSYNLAMTAWYLCQWFPELDSNLVIKYALAHDLVEIHAGDTFFAGTEEELSSKAEREEKALQTLRADWPDFAEMTESAADYEKKDSPEACFVYALDKVMPIMLVYIHNGYSWRHNEVTAQMLQEYKADKIALSPQIKPFFDQLYRLLLERPELFEKS